MEKHITDITLRIQAHSQNRIFLVPIPSEKNRNVAVIFFLGYTWILRVMSFSA